MRQLKLINRYTRSSQYLIKFFYLRVRIIRKEMTIGPNKILLLPEDLIFVAAKSSIFQSRVIELNYTNLTDY